MLKAITRALVEVGFILFLFYANLLMGEYSHSGASQGHSFCWALNDVLTLDNFIIGLVAAVIGYFVFEFLRKRV